MREFENQNNNDHCVTESCENKHYTCGFCGRTYDDVKNRMACETVCHAKWLEAEKNKKKEKLAKEKEDRRKIIEEKTRELRKLIADYIKDYGSLTIKDLGTTTTSATSKFLDIFDNGWWI